MYSCNRSTQTSSENTITSTDSLKNDSTITELREIKIYQIHHQLMMAIIHVDRQLNSKMMMSLIMQ